MILPRLLLVVAIFAVPGLASAGQSADALSRCLADHTSGKDRKELASWVFVAMSAHPEIHSLSRVDDAVRDARDRSMARLVTRLLTESCATEARVAIDKEGAAAMRISFESLGQLAMQELMTNPAVSAAFSGFDKHIDRQKLQTALTSR